MKSIQCDGLLKFKTKLDTKQIKDAPSFSENSMLLKKQSLEVCKLRVLIYVQWGALGIPKLMVFTILGLLLVWCSSIPCEKTSTQNFLPILFYGVTLVVQGYHGCCYFIHK